MLRLSRKNTDLVVGVFVAAALLSLVFIALRAANVSDLFLVDNYQVRVQFDEIGSLNLRAPVKSSGVRVGWVDAVVFNNDDYVAEVHVAIESQYRFPTDSLFAIVSGNLLGGQYIAVEVGGDDEFFRGGEVVQGQSAVVLESLISQFMFGGEDES